MGFGSGYSSRTKRGGKSYNNEMTAHVWNSQSEREGQSSNGNFYFRGRTLYSYGSHFVCGYIMPGGVVFLNADSYSISTSGHMSDARGATRDRRSASIAALTKIAGDWGLLPRVASFREIVESRGATRQERKEIQAFVLRQLVEHAERLDVQIYPANESRYSGGYYSDADSKYVYPDTDYPRAGAYLAELVGLPVASWTKAQRDAAKAKAKREASEAAALAARNEARALQLSDMSDSRFRDWIAELGAQYSDSQLRDIGKDLKRSRSLALHAKRGKLASKARLAKLRERIKRVDSAVAAFDEMNALRQSRRSLRQSLAIVKAWRDASEAGRSAVSFRQLSDIARAAEFIASKGIRSALMESAARLATQANAGCKAIEAENARLRAIEAENAKKAEAERVQLWYAGERVGRLYFDAATGGAALRIMGDTLETSHGASVPLEHAVKAFRFIKLCRERGESFHRNGRTIRVGHFQVDSISESGDFKAGCHSFTWPEVERVAKLAGVFDATPSAEAIEVTPKAA
jgi:hypothetical protein